MATKREFFRKREDGVDLYRTYSDEGWKLMKVGTDEVYDDAVDEAGAPFKYVEIAEKIEEVV